MSVLGQLNINKGKHLLPGVCTQQTKPKETETSTHSRKLVSPMHIPHKNKIMFSYGLYASF